MEIQSKLPYFARSMSTLNLWLQKLMFISKKYIDVDFQDTNGKTALHYACATQEGEHTVSLLLRYGAQVEIRDDDQKTPLDIVKTRNYTEHTQRLLTQYSIY